MKIAVCAAVLVSALFICGCASQQSAVSAASPEPAAGPPSAVTEVVPMRHWSTAATKFWLEQHDRLDGDVRYEFDERTNSVIIHGAPEKVERVRTMLAQIDRPC